MATITLKTLTRGQATGSTVVYYTAPTNTRALIKSATFFNTTNGAVTLQVYLVQDPNQDGGTSRAINAVSVAASPGATATYVATEMTNQMLEAGGKIYIAGNGINFVISGAEITS
jgi:hypothetical protein